MAFICDLLSPSLLATRSATLSEPIERFFSAQSVAFSRSSARIAFASRILSESAFLSFLASSLINCLSGSCTSFLSRRSAIVLLSIPAKAALKGLLSDTFGFDP